MFRPLNRKLNIYLFIAFLAFIIFLMIANDLPFYFPVLFGLAIAPFILECLTPSIYFNDDEIFIKYLFSEEKVKLSKVESLGDAPLFVFAPGFQPYAYYLEFISNRKRIKIKFVDSGRYQRNANFLEFLKIVKGQNFRFEMRS